MPLGREVDGGSNYKCSDFEDRKRILERITMNITFEHHGRVQNENRKIFMISLQAGFAGTHKKRPANQAHHAQEHRSVFSLHQAHLNLGATTGLIIHQVQPNEDVRQVLQRGFAPNQEVVSRPQQFFTPISSFR
jgi:hypothetical protein